MNDSSVSLVVVTVLLSAGPLFLLSTTAYVKTSTVLHIVRSAIGADGVPGTAVVTAFAFAISLLVMAPVAREVAVRAEPLLEQKDKDGTKTIVAALDAAKEPLRAFVRANASSKDRARYLELAKKAAGKGVPPGEDDFAVLLPAFLTTELGEAFQLGFLLLLPFLVIDLAVAAVLSSLGLSLPPRDVALALKLLLFGAVDGFALVAQALVASYG